MTNYIGKILRLPEVLLRTGLSRSMLYELMKDGQFVQPIRLGKRCVGWFEPEVDEWILSRVQHKRVPFIQRVTHD